MRFMSLWRPAQHASTPTEKAMVAIGMSKAGVLIQWGWAPTSPCTVC